MLSFIKAKAQAPRARKATLGVHELGERIVPAGLIDVTFQNGTLNIVGDANANTLTVNQTADGRLTLSTDIGTAMKVNGANVVGFMGATLASPVTGAVTVNMGDGFDSLTFSGATEDIDLPGALTINNGDGNNLLTFMQGVTVGGNTTITNGADLDTIHLNDETNFLGKLTINNGAGGSLLDANAMADLRVGGVFAVTSGAGFDKLTVEAAKSVTLGGFTLKTGADADGSDTDLSPTDALTVNGKVTVTNGAGDDLLDIGDPTLVTKITGAVAINNGAGANHTDLVGADTLSVGGPISVTGGANDDLVHLGINSGNVSFGAVTVTAGAGNNGVIVAGVTLNVLGNLTVTGGAGADTVQVLATNDAMITGAVNVTAGAGQNTVEMHADSGHTLTLGKTLTFTSTSAAANTNSVYLRDIKALGATAVTTGAGNDTISIDDAMFNGTFTLKTGDGKDTVNIEQQAILTGHTMFNKAVVIQTGAGDDTVKLSGVLAEPERKAIFNASAKFDGGAGADTLALSDFGANLFYGPAPVKVSF